MLLPKGSIIAALLLIGIFRNSIAQEGGEVQELIFPTALDTFSRASDPPGTLLFATVYIVTNLGPEIGPSQVLFEACRNNGQCFWGWGGGPRPLTTDGMIIGPRLQSTIPDEHEGWTRLQVPSTAKVAARAEVYAFVRIDSNRNLVDTVTVEAVKPARVFRATLINRDQFREFPPPNSRLSAYAVVNPSRNASARIDLTAFDRLGNKVCATSFDLAPRNRVAKLVTEFLAPCAPPIEGMARFTSDIPIAVNAIDLLGPEGQLLSVPVTAENPP